jgi:hypothetical protein
MYVQRKFKKSSKQYITFIGYYMDACYFTQDILYKDIEKEDINYPLLLKNIKAFKVSTNILLK